jgi:hypothetical protein
MQCILPHVRSPIVSEVKVWDLLKGNDSPLRMLSAVRIDLLEAVCSSKTSGCLRTIQQYSPRDCIQCSDHRENLKPIAVVIVVKSPFRFTNHRSSGLLVLQQMHAMLMPPLCSSFRICMPSYGTVSMETVCGLLKIGKPITSRDACYWGGGKGTSCPHFHSELCSRYTILNFPTVSHLVSLHFEWSHLGGALW